MENKVAFCFLQFLLTSDNTFAILRPNHSSLNGNRRLPALPFQREPGAPEFYQKGDRHEYDDFEGLRLSFSSPWSFDCIRRAGPNLHMSTKTPQERSKTESAVLNGASFVFQARGPVWKALTMIRFNLN